MEKNDGSKKAVFTIAERISIVQVMPEKDNFEGLIIREEIINKVKITSDEIEAHNIETDKNGGISWQDNGVTFNYDFNMPQINYLRENLRELSEKKELNAALLNIYKIFV